jgi:chromosome segregation ATPase
MMMSKHYDPDIWRYRDYEALNADIRKQLSAALQRIAELETEVRNLNASLEDACREIGARRNHAKEAAADIDRLMESANSRIDELEAENERLREIIDTRLPDQGRQIERLRAVYEAAKNDMKSAKANCGKFPESSRDCSSWIERGMRCSDCPVEVWLAETSDALAAAQEDDDE